MMALGTGFKARRHGVQEKPDVARQRIRFGRIEHAGNSGTAKEAHDYFSSVIEVKILATIP